MRYSVAPDGAAFEDLRPEYLLLVENGGAPETANDTGVTFGKVADVDILSDGTLAVLDRIAARVYLLDRDGELRAVAGRRGQGPGELSGGLSLAVIPLPGARFAVPDVANNAIPIFDATGQVVDVLPFGTGSEVIPEWRSLSGDTVAVRRATSSVEILQARTLDGRLASSGIRLPRIDHAPSAMNPGWPLMPDRWVWSAYGGGWTAVARMSEPAVALYLGERLVRLITWPAPAGSEAGGAVTEEEVEHLLKVVARSQGLSRVTDEIRASIRAPEERYVLADILVGPGGWILTQRPRPIREMDERILSTLRAEGAGGPLWDVFDASGNHRGVMDFGTNVELFQIRGDTLVGVREDEFGVQHVFLARVPGLMGS
ncbi:MAG: hypothetical protein RQ745_06160 [Longimicrobiales bacterium]|nr:hypothetical protein [Longimicrobiales bacterium]